MLTFSQKKTNISQKNTNISQFINNAIFHIKCQKMVSNIRWKIIGQIEVSQKKKMSQKKIHS